MNEPLKILFISAEAAPFAKAGGLGDVAGSLPKALQQLGHDVRVVMPAYQKIEQGYPGVDPMPGTLWVPVRDGVVEAGSFLGKLPNSEVPIYFIAHQQLFNRPEIYGYHDDSYRFAFFSRAALELTKAIDWKPDLIHAHDWHTAPALTWLSTAGQGQQHFRDISTIFTIHNLAHQGLTRWDIFDYLGLQSHSLSEESYGMVNFMARGIHHATLVNTVSPTYVKEILSSEGGTGMQNLLNHRQFDVHGILNGLDYEVWNPETDTRLPHHFSADDLESRQKVRHALQDSVGLPRRDGVPIVALISRLDWQKGLDITGHVINQLLSGFAGEAQFIVLGTGAKEYENMFATLAKHHPSKMSAILSYNAGLAPLIYGGSDMFIMPSRFEPCGLGQLIAMRYGSVPVVRATGGLADTVIDGHTGFSFSEYSAGAFSHALGRAMWTYYHDKPHWQQIQQNGLMSDFSWDQSALNYQQLYEWAISRTRGW